MWIAGRAEPTNANAPAAVTRIAEQAPAKAGRLVFIDGVRGFLLLMMMLAHIHLKFPTPLFYLHIGRYAPLYDAEFFILISGLACALAFHGAYVHGGMAGSFKAVLKRLRWLYLYQIAATLLIVAFVKVAGPIAFASSGVIASMPMSQIVPAMLGLGLQADYLMILVIYMNLMPFIPVAMKLLHQESARLYFGIILGLWLLAASGLDLITGSWIDTAFAPLRDYVRLSGSFNPFSYALPFYGGFYLGFRLKTEGRENLARIVPLRMDWFVAATIVNIAFAAIEATHSTAGWPDWLFDRVTSSMTIPSMLSTVSLAYTVYFLLSSPALSGTLLELSKALRWLFTRRILVVTGQNSLFVYSVHVVICWVAMFTIVRFDLARHPLLLNAVVITAVAALPPFAYLKRRYFPTLA